MRNGNPLSLSCAGARPGTSVQQRRACPDFNCDIQAKSRFHRVGAFNPGNARQRFGHIPENEVLKLQLQEFDQSGSPRPLPSIHHKLAEGQKFYKQLLDAPWVVMHTGRYVR